MFLFASVCGNILTKLDIVTPLAKYVKISARALLSASKLLHKLVDGV